MHFFPKKVDDFFLLMHKTLYNIFRGSALKTFYFYRNFIWPLCHVQAWSRAK